MSEVKQHWTAEENRNYDPAWVLRYDPTPQDKQNADGSTSYSMTFPALQVTDWVGDPENSAKDIALKLNAYPDILSALKDAIGALEFSRDYHNDLGNEEQDFAQRKLDAALKAVAKAEGRQ